MVYFAPICLISLFAASANGAPLSKRIAQVISDSTTKWEAACNAAGGGAQCNAVAVASFGTLLAAPGPCEQQQAADNMIDLAKTLNNDPDTIKFAQIFAQQPRNSPNSLSVPYCQQAPKNAELNGLFQCQFQGSNPTSFVGGLSPGQTGTIPFGMTKSLSPAGSCPANPTGPIVDGTQLTDITSNPGVTSSSAGSGAASPSATEGSVASTPSSSSKSKGSMSMSGGPGAGPDGECPDDQNPDSTTPAAAVTATGSATSAPKSAGGFQLQNGKDAQTLNAKFATLTTSSSCNEGDEACVDSGFAQCVGGKFEVSQCGSTLICAALPLVNKAGTSITCTTEADAEARIQATGATGGLTG